MKTKITFFAIMFPVIIWAQTTSPEVVASAGEYFSNNGYSLSWTVGEIATETFDNGTNIITQGFQQPVTVAITGVNLDLLVYLEGPYKNSGMETALNSGSVIPLSQPYNTAPWNYSGSESVTSIPNTNVVDWVLVELRDASSAAGALPGTTIGRQAAFLLTDGSVVATDGSSNLYFNVTVNHNLYVVIWHRNHLGIMSANALTQSGGLFTYDFSTSVSQVYNGSAGYKEIVTGVAGMVAGDANADGDINNSDKSLWSAQAGSKGYKQADFDMNVQVDNKDKNDMWVNNGSYSTQVPH